MLRCGSSLLALCFSAASLGVGACGGGGDTSASSSGSEAEGEEDASGEASESATGVDVTQTDSGDGDGDTSDDETGTTGDPPDPEPNPFTPSDACVNQANALIATMTNSEKAGQMTQADVDSLSAGDVTTFQLGSVLAGGGSGPESRERADWVSHVEAFKGAALATDKGIPLLYAIDAVHGHNAVVGATIFPHNIGLGCANDPDLLEQIAEVTAAEVRGTGIDWTFAPVLAAARDIRWGRSYEAFGERPELAASYASAGTRGLQGLDLSDDPTRVLACAKHFAGDGGTTNGDDQGDTQLDDATFRALHVDQFKDAIDAGVATVMASFSSINGVKMHEAGEWLTDVLKDEFGFQGFVISDWDAVEQLSGNTYAEQLADSVNAGVDMIMVSDETASHVSTLSGLIGNEISTQRADDAVRRILSVKCEMGLWEQPAVDAAATQAIGSAEHRAIARQAVAQSMVLLKNGGDLLPLSTSASALHVAGSSADDMERQTGAWTLGWQAPEMTPIGATISEGIENLASMTTTLTSSDDASGANGSEDAVIVVIGEPPYAEWLGDVPDEMSLEVSDTDRAAVANARASGAPVVVVLVSGRPLILGTVLDDADAIVAAWLPGTEGAGVADVLFGEVGPTGTLSQSWPTSADDLPLNEGDAGYNPLFALGYGLTYD